ncbi:MULTISPECIES: DUF455 family protein [unclassified Paenibacillus]|uniref:DUF455 family protein n=1 Tax=unclassified Paenibacillus TaxID=185978 RepID=UPI002F3FC17D
MSGKIEVDLNDYSFLEQDRELRRGMLRPIDTAALLKTFYWLEFELSRMTMGWAPSFADWDIKGKLVRMSYLHTTHMMFLEERINELPGSNIGRKDWTPEAMREAFERISIAPSTEAFAAAYNYAAVQLYDRYAKLTRLLDQILDAPTLERLKYIETDRIELTQWGTEHAQFAFMDDMAARAEFFKWQDYVRDTWKIMELKLDHQSKGSALQWPAFTVENPVGPVPPKAAVDPRYPLVDLTKFKSAMFDPKSPTHNSVKHMVFINASEMSAAETMTYLYYGVQRMPMEFYYDVARHTWDEVRHSQMGVRRLKQMGYKTEDFSWHPSTVPSKENMDTAFPEFYSALTMVMEPCSFIKKRKSIDAFLDHGDPMSSIQSEFDIADERLHVNFGKKWGAKLFEHIDDFETAQSVEKKAKQMHLQRMGYEQAEIDSVLNNFPEFCGFATMDLKYDQY